MQKDKSKETLKGVIDKMNAVIDMVPGGTLINIPAGQWHSLRSLESGTVLLECKDGPWAPLGGEDILQ